MWNRVVLWNHPRRSEAAMVRSDSGVWLESEPSGNSVVRATVALTKLQECLMWLRARSEALNSEDLTNGEA